MNGPQLPDARGELSATVLDALLGGPWSSPPLDGHDPYGDDLQLALHPLYEPHYRGFEGVPDDREWDPGLLALRRPMEQRFLQALRTSVPPHRDAEQALGDLLVEPAGHDDTSLSHHLHRDGEVWQFREYALVAIEFDKFGAGRADEMHARLYADLMRDVGLETPYGHYLHTAPAEALATVNLMSLFGLHRALRGALVGHFAAVEVTSSPSSRRLAMGLRRLDAGAAAQRFYDEHVEADAVHEQVVRHEVVGGLLTDEPHRERDIVFGIHSTGFLEDRLAVCLLKAWHQQHSALRVPLSKAEGGRNS
ncbi:iron-containing redox enzyme family protein [Streptomyces sp. NPDC048419]|uniref:iron-containing redox enzyme family protein n=1 Tax=Streptomyces sp. NPDC048419 TaxID=3365547 RepID=UPI003718951A